MTDMPPLSQEERDELLRKANEAERHDRYPLEHDAVWCSAHHDFECYATPSRVKALLATIATLTEYVARPRRRMGCGMLREEPTQPCPDHHPCLPDVKPEGVSNAN